MTGIFSYIGGILFSEFFSSLLHGGQIFGLTGYSYLMYSDIPNFFQRAIAHGWPYISIRIEYPVLIGLFVKSMALIGHTLFGYYAASVLALMMLGGIATYLLYLMVPPQSHRKLWLYWIFAPSMVVFSIYNWDLLAIVCVVAAMYAVWKKHDLTAALFLTLGTWAKLYPVLYLLPLFLNQKTNRARAGIAGIFAAVSFALNAPFAFANFSGWAYFFTFNSARISTFDSIWTIFRFLFPGLQNEATINSLSLLIFATWYLAMVWRFRKESLIKSWFLATLIFLMTNKVFSPQYLLWLLPFFVVLPTLSYGKFLTFEFANLGILVLTLTWFFVGQDLAYFYLSIPLILVKYGMMFVFYREMARRKLPYRVLAYEPKAI
ncbi:MAG: DUF2029 domain-containing protein [Patescibacteria group bacterium]|nr:DUF2029 domain-containing protein [Patescibacteria group bacterium]